MCCVTFAHAHEFEVTLKTRYGILKTNESFELMYKGKPIPGAYLPSTAYLAGEFKLSESDLLLISGGGNACPGHYVYVTIDKAGARATPSFGTCYDEMTTPVQQGDVIAFSMPKLSRKGTSRYIYAVSYTHLTLPTTPYV